MKFKPTPLQGAYIIDLSPLQDNRGLFMRTFCKNDFQQIGHDQEFVQFNHSINHLKGTLRGMHYQLPPHTEVKLIRCIAGKVYDVIVDLREESPTYLQWFGTELSKDNFRMMYVPQGFAHGFITLEDNSELLYHHTEYYTPLADRGIRFDDPALHIQWPVPIELVSEKDRNYKLIDADFNGVCLNHK